MMLSQLLLVAVWLPVTHALRAPLRRTLSVRALKMMAVTVLPMPDAGAFSCGTLRARAASFYSTKRL